MPAEPLERCIFCGSKGPLTNEHIIPRWVHPYIPRTARSYRTLRAVQHQDRSTFKIGRRSGDPRDWKVRCVCGNVCNNGWMRQLEHKVRPILVPILTGKHTRISPAQQKIIAAWATMKAMVAEYDDPGFVTTHHTQRKRLRNKQLPPENGWAIWLGYFPRAIPIPTWTSHPFLALSRKQREARRHDLATYYNAQASTQVIGQLFIHVIRMPEPKFVRKWWFPRLPDGGILVRIWPVADFSIVWPTFALSERDAYLASRAFRRRAEAAMFRGQNS